MSASSCGQQACFYKRIEERTGAANLAHDNDLIRQDPLSLGRAKRELKLCGALHHRQ